MISSIPPMIVMYNNCHQPVLSVSCNLLAATANEGNKRTTVKIQPIGPVTSTEKPNIITSIMAAMIPPKIPNKKNHQNSDRDALPEKTAYLLKQVFIEV